MDKSERACTDLATPRGACYGRRVAGKRALFLDWGGTLVLTRDNRAVLGPDGHPIPMPNVERTLARVRPDFDACFIVSNQARIARGEITEAEVRARFEWLDRRLGGLFTDWRLCPHCDGDSCACRKPRPGMFLDLARAWNIDLAASMHVGNSEKDRDAARAAGIGRFALGPRVLRLSARTRRSVESPTLHPRVTRA